MRRRVSPKGWSRKSRSNAASVFMPHHNSAGSALRRRDAALHRNRRLRIELAWNATRQVRHARLRDATLLLLLIGLDVPEAATQVGVQAQDAGGFLAESD